MSLLTLHRATLTVSNTKILDDASFTIGPRERIALVGRNGAGKSTFLKVLQGEMVLDSGQLNKLQGLTTTMLLQDVPCDYNGSVLSYLVSGLGPLGEMILMLKAQGADGSLPSHLVDDVQKGYMVLAEVESIADKLGLRLEDNIASLSGGMKRRVLLAGALVAKPALLLLDEPTNHLDLPSIEWLEHYLKASGMSVIFVTHDRYFLNQVATEIVELDRGGLYRYPGEFETYLQRRAERIDAEERANALFDKKLKQEEIWIRTGIKARRTRNEGRVRALKQMRREHEARRSELGKMNINGLDVTQSGMLVLMMENVSFSYGDAPLIKDLSLLISRKDKLAIIGPNGCGKTTLLKLMLGELTPTEGTLKRGTQLEIAYFSQLREALQLDATVMDNVADGASHVVINGQTKHVASYLKDFLFSPEKFNQPVSSLSGGERNRLMLAKLFAKPVNFLVMDEPTNDLDIESLEMLEDVLTQYTGTLILISHDRAFVDSVATSVLVYEGEGKFGEYLGGYRDYQSAQKSKPIEKPKPTDKPKRTVQKLSFNEQRELKHLPAQIEALEREIALIHQQMSEGTFYQQEPAIVASKSKILQEDEARLAALYKRWEDLEERA